MRMIRMCLHTRLIGIVFIIGTLTVQVSRVSAQGYKKKADFVYSFHGADSILPIEIRKGMIQLPDLAENSHTAFLELKMKSNLLGVVWQPFIRIGSDGESAIQYFDYGSRGRRYLNVSDFVQKGSVYLELDTKQCRIRNADCQLIVYTNPPVSSEKIVVLAPHPDDAEISAYGLYAGNTETTVVNITVGDAGKKMYDELYAEDTVHYAKKANLRLWNSITTPLLAGLDPQNCLNLGYFDATLKYMYTQPEKPVHPRYMIRNDVQYFRDKNISDFLDTIPAQATWRSLVTDLQKLIEAKKPTVIVSPYPAIDVHPDHKLTTVALLEALKQLEYPDVKLYLYTNHYIHSEMYPCGKKGSLISLPPTTGSDSIFFEALYSQTLDVVSQGDKTLALEAMNPLRPDTEWHTTRGSWKLFRKTWKENMRNSEQDYYYRRAVRNNELFFIIHSNTILNDSAVYNVVLGDMKFLNE